jgi:hypothetical protein
MSIETELGTLIRRLNPHTEGKPGRMRFTPDNPVVDAKADEPNLSHVELEVEGTPTKSSNYATQWIFKGQAQNIVKAVRIKYQYPVDGDGKILATDYLLVGYEGSPGS